MKFIQKIISMNVFFILPLSACPFTMINDSKKTILVIDEQNKQAFHIAPGKSAHIDPTLHGWRKYVRKETLDVYLERANQAKDAKAFDRRYRFTEKYCPVDAKTNEIRLSSLQKLAKNPTDRMRVQEFTPKNK